MHAKQSRGWDRGSPGRRRPGVERDFHRRDTGSPDRFKRGRWESPPRNRIDSPGRMRRKDYESPSRAGRKDAPISPKSRRGGFDDGPNPSLSERRRLEDDYYLRMMHQDVLQEARGPAASRGGLNLVPEAFLESKGTYEAQVRFIILRECLPLADDIVNDVLRENFSQRGKFDCELSADQVLKILQLFSRQEMRPGLPGQEREWAGQDGRNMSLGVNGLDPDGRHFPSLPGLDLMGRTPVDGGLPPDPAVILGQGMIEEADQLALKYLQNNPAIAGIRLEPVNISLLSSSLRNNAQPNHTMDHDQGGFAAVNLQPNGTPFPAGQNPRFLGLPGGSGPDSANIDRMEHLGADGGKRFGQFLPGSLGGGERGLLPMPSMQHHIPGMPPVNQAGFPPSLPNQPGMIRPFPPAGPFPMAAGPLASVPPEFGGPHLPFHPLQGSHAIPPHLGNPSQLGNPLQAGNRPNNRQGLNAKGGNNKQKKNKQQKKRSKHQKVLGGGYTNEKKNEPDDKDGAAAEPAESAEA
ncbi:hypothetical protein GOP47_0005563 [Adiantum capillus-veneris]|uniref:DCD domain-containing protein n=1 Tax=Adiantum capillus-veneris TaxID=13818 RepID=A0A9D4V5C9_ADICA|nr:hypothetical protein GOP47_0005563 [Adiantum capillus-veneris]